MHVAVNLIGAAVQRFGHSLVDDTLRQTVHRVHIAMRENLAVICLLLDIRRHTYLALGLFVVARKRLVLQRPVLRDVVQRAHPEIVGQHAQ